MALLLLRTGAAQQCQAGSTDEACRAQREIFPIRLGIIGAARIAPRAVITPIRENANLSQEIIVTAVAARTQAKATAFAEEHDVPTAYGSYDDLLADTEVDAVYIALPNAYHAEWAIKALQSGKHVLVEKPFTNNADEVQAIVAASKASGKIAVEAWHMLHHPLASRTRMTTISNSIGDIKHVDCQFKVNFETYDAGIRSTMHAPTPMYDDIRFDLSLGGGVTMDIASYCIRLIRHVTDWEPKVKRAKAKKWDKNPEIDLEMSADFTFPGKSATAHLDASYIAGKNDVPLELEIRGSKATLKVKGFQRPHVDNSMTIVFEGEEISNQRADGPLPNTQSTMFFQLKRFARQVWSTEIGKKLPNLGWSCWAEDAALNMKVIDDVYKAAGLSPRPSLAPSA